MAPANPEAEEAVLGALLIDPSAVVRVATHLRAEDFHRPAHQKIFAAIVGLYNRHLAVDVVTVSAELERDGTLEQVGGAPFLAELMQITPLALHVEHYAEVVHRYAVRRRLIDAGGAIAKIGWGDPGATIEETVDAAEAVLYGVMKDRARQDLVPIRDVLEEYFEQIERLQTDKNSPLGVGTEFEDLDRLLGRLQPSDLCIVAGRPGMGKTSWLLTVAHNIAVRRGVTVAMFSLEMSALQLVQRLIASETGVSTNRLRLGQIRADEMELVARAIGLLESVPMYIDDTPGLSPFELRTKARRLHAERRVGLVIVDYLQLMHGGTRSENRVQEISFISRALKGLARELGVPVIAASQLSRAVESRHEKRPLLSDLRESGSIEQDADIVLFLYRDQSPDAALLRPNVTEVIVAKHRHGPTGSVELVFVPDRTRFESAAIDLSNGHYG
jgi:replicative DNA helicase